MENETRRDMLETYAKALEGDSMPLDAAKVLAGRMEADKAFRDAVLLMAGFDFLPRLKAGDSYPASLMGHRSSMGSRFTGDRVAAGQSQPPSHIASTGV